MQDYYDPESKGIYPIPISWWDYQHEDVYILVTKRKAKSRTFKFQLQFKYIEVPGMSLISKVFLAIFLSILGVAMGIGTLYILHRKNIIEVRIPPPCRVYCFKNYLSPEEKAEIADAERIVKQIEV